MTAQNYTRTYIFLNEILFCINDNPFQLDFFKKHFLFLYVYICYLKTVQYSKVTKSEGTRKQKKLTLELLEISFQ